MYVLVFNTSVHSVGSSVVTVLKCCELPDILSTCTIDVLPQLLAQV